MYQLILSHRRMILNGIVGITAFIFFGFFLPILLSTNPEKSENTVGVRQVGPNTRDPMTTTGADVIKLSLLQFNSFINGTAYAIGLHCLKQSNRSRCDQSVYTTKVPVRLISLFDALATDINYRSFASLADQLYERGVQQCDLDDKACEEMLPAMFVRNPSDDRSYQRYKKAAAFIAKHEANTMAERILQIHALVQLAKITNDTSYIVIAQTRYSQLISKFDTSENPIVYTATSSLHRFDCGTQWIAAELAAQVQDTKVVSAAEEFFRDNEPYYMSVGQLGALDLCLEGLSYMERKTQDSYFTAEKKKLIEYILSTYWDNPLDSKFTGDYGFLLLDPYANKLNSTLNYKYLAESAWFLEHVLPYKSAFLTF